MSIIYSHKWPIVLLLLLISCSNVKFKVYGAKLEKKHIHLEDTNTVVVLVNFVACIPCIPEVIEHYLSKDKYISVVTLVQKNIVFIKMIKNKQSVYPNDRVSYFYQFSKKNDSYAYRKTNRLFRKFKHFESPIVLITDAFGKTKIITPSEFNKSKR